MNFSPDGQGYRIGPANSKAVESFNGGVVGLEVAETARNEALWIRAHLVGKRVLDVGCRQGFLAILLARDGFDVTGLDSQAEAIAYAQKASRRENEVVQANLNFINGNLWGLASSDTFDTIIVRNEIGRQELPAIFFGKALGHLNENGVIIVSTFFGCYACDEHENFIFPSDFVKIAEEYALEISEFNVIDDRIRIVFSKYSAAGLEMFRRSLLSFTEQGALESQRRLLNRIAEQSAQLKAQGDLLKHLQRDHASQLSRIKKDCELAKAQDRVVIKERIQGHLSYKWGAALLAAFNNPVRFLFLPWVIYREWKYHSALNRDFSFGVRVSKIFSNAVLLSVIDLLKFGGVQKVIERVIFLSRELTSSEIAESFIFVSQYVGERGDIESSFVIAQTALKYSHNINLLHAVVLAAVKTNRVDFACNLMTEMEILSTEGTDENSLKQLRRLRRNPAYHLAALALIGSKQEKKLDSVPKRICYVLHNSLPYSSGGYATRAQGVASGLNDSGYEVIIMTRPGFPLDTKPDLKAEDVREVDCVDGFHYYRTLEPSRKDMQFRDYVFAAADLMEERFREFAPEIVIAASNYIVALPALIAARRLGLPFVYEVRGFWEITKLSRNPAYSQDPAYKVQTILEATVANSSEIVFTLTGAMREELVNRGVDASKIHLLPNSVAPDRFVPKPRDAALAEKLGIPDGTIVIGYIGTFVDYEGLDDLAQACALLKKKGVCFRLLLVGNENTSGTDKGHITEHIQQTALEAGFSNWLIMPGRIPHAEVESYYSLIDIAPFPRKPLPVCEMVSPMKPLEALAMEKAVLVSSVSALLEMISDGVTGVVFEKGNIRAMASKLDELIENSLLRERLGKQGRQWVTAERTWTEVGRKFKSEYSKIYC